MAARKKYDGKDRFRRCQLCDATQQVCEGFYKRDKGLPSCCHSCEHTGKEDKP